MAGIDPKNYETLIANQKVFTRELRILRAIHGNYRELVRVLQTTIRTSEDATRKKTTVARLQANIEAAEKDLATFKQKMREEEVAGGE